MGSACSWGLSPSASRIFFAKRVFEMLGIGGISTLPPETLVGKDTALVRYDMLWKEITS
jgi:hypothetical protein